MAAHIAAFGLECKQLDQAVDGARLLGPRVQGTGGNTVEEPLNRVTCSICIVLKVHHTFARVRMAPTGGAMAEVPCK